MSELKLYIGRATVELKLAKIALKRPQVSQVHVTSVLCKLTFSQESSAINKKAPQVTFESEISPRMLLKMNVSSSHVQNTFFLPSL